jgi:CRISPR system Cascade subunit CasE
VFLSKLTPDPRHRGVRRDLANPYDLHRTLLRAFPDADAGGPGRVLFRVELPRGGPPYVLVQSERGPLWADLPAGYLAACQTKALDGLAFRAGQRLAFRVRANPTKRAGKSAPGPSWAGKRVGLCREEEQQGWLLRKGEEGGFRVSPAGLRLTAEGTVVARKGGMRLQFQAVLFEGVFEVADPARFLGTLAEGVGSGKGLGFGLLSVAPLPA